MFITGTIISCWNKPPNFIYKILGDVFVLETPVATYVWHGKHSADSEKLVGDNVAKILTPNREPTVLQEESEPQDFWQSIGGYKSYSKQKHLENIPVIQDSRLLQVCDEYD